MDTGEQMAEVYFAPVGLGGGKGILEKIGVLFKRAGFSEIMKDRDLVAVKTHFGEYGCSSFIPGIYIRRVVESISGQGARPFLTDSGVLYLGKRRNAAEHVVTAHHNGFTLSTTGAPIVIADGLIGSDVFPCRVSGKYFENVDIAGAVADADSLVVVSHVTGHGLTGFAGAFKNLGMGCVGRKVKLSIHELVKPCVDDSRCDACGSCFKICPVGAISFGDEKSAVIDLDLCIGCGECMEICPQGAITIEWKGETGRAQEKLAEAASAVIVQKRGAIAFFNFLLNVTPSCDCFQRSSSPMVPDIGICASLDPVALDQASADLVMAAPDAFERKGDPAGRFDPLGGGSWGVALEYAESMGLGNRSYDLVRV
jgi:uncharacterized protein